MARKPSDVKKLVSFSEDTRELRERIVQISLKTGLTESRIIEDCIICGFGFLYGTKEDVPEIVSMMTERHGNLVDTGKLKNWVEKGQF